MFKSLSTSLKDKLSRPGQGNVEVTTTTEVHTSPADPLTTTIKTTTTTDSFSDTLLDEQLSLEKTVANGGVREAVLQNILDEKADTAVSALLKAAEISPRSSSERARMGFKRMLETFTHKENTTTTTIQEHPEGEINVDSQESTFVVSYYQPHDVITTITAATTPDASDSTPETPTQVTNDKIYPGTINAKFVKEQSKQQNMHGLKHALSASIQKSGAHQKPEKLFEGGILTSANHKTWYHTTIPINWVQKISTQYHFGNYVVSDRKTGSKTWEDMPIYARIGMHLLFAGMLDRRLLQTHRIHHLFSVESVNQGKHFDAPESVAQIDHFIKIYKLDLSELLEPNTKLYRSFNEFFYRKLRPDARPIYAKDDPNIIVSSADCRLCVFESITAATQVWIKGKSFSMQQLVRDEALAAQFEGGSIAIFRLAPQDYHRFHSPVTGSIVKEPIKIDGTYFTVNPMAVNANLNVFTDNVRKVTVIDLEQQQREGEEKKNGLYDQCIFVSIGALLVGSIQLTGAQQPGNRVQKGDELGYFAYGGSTCILLFKTGAVQFDEDLVAHSLKGLETLVRMGERIGERK
ncbi:hypothetical protein EDD11_010601 [Mortierella claussenii]|nr:hypothetical protein EDD11_010601 [Mortierella claussenii]